MMRDLNQHPELCAINTATLGFQKPIGEVIDAVARAGFGGLAPWRREMEGQNIKAIGKQISDAGLQVTGYCRSTFLTSNSEPERAAAIEENYRALDDAAALGANSFMIVSGTLPQGSKNLAKARQQVAEGVSKLSAHAKNLGVKIAIEPLHPVYALDRSCINLISQALDMCDEIGTSNVGICIDAYHTWWDPNLARDCARAGREGRIFGFHVSDLKLVRGLVENAGFNGLVEVELFSTEKWWKRPIEDTLQVLKERFSSAV
jgi:sugar phosphate isomerase/epimerase